MEKVIIKNNESSLCAKCNGKCCKKHSCETHPDDVFGKETPTLERLLEFLSCGKYQIDWWEGDIRGRFGIKYDESTYRFESYHIRPAHTNSLGILFDPAYFDYNKPESCRDWFPYNDMIDTIRREYEWTYNEDGTITFIKKN